MTDLLKQLRVLHASAEAYRSGFAIIDQDSKIIYANRMMEKLFGFDSGEMDGMDLNNIIDQSQPHPHRGRLERRGQDVKHFDAEGVVMGVHKSGEKVSVKVYNRTKFSDGGDVYFSAIVDPA